MTTDVRLTKVDSIPLAVVRRAARPNELATLVPHLCGVVWNALRQQHIKGGRHVAVYWDGAIHLEVGVELYGDFAEEGDVVRSATPAGDAVCATHFGPYHRLGQAHDAIHEWSANNGQRRLGANWEIYGHWEDAWNQDSSLIRTDVFYQLLSDA